MNESVDIKLSDIIKLIEAQRATNDALYELVRLVMDKNKDDNRDRPRMMVLR